MEMTFRWYGSQEEKITLDEIRQIPAVKGIVGTLMDIPVGEVWPRERIKELKEKIESRGLTRLRKNTLIICRSYLTD